MNLRSPSRKTEEGENSLPDGALVLAAREGDKRAFVQIVARHQAMVTGVAYAILGDFAGSEDAAQEAFLTAWRRIHDLREPGKLKSWLCQISRNAALGHLRRARGTEPLEEALETAESAPGPAEQAATEEEAKLVRDTLAQLPENYRVPLILYYREGQSISAVATTLGLSDDAVKQRLSRGREMMREQMSGLVESVLGRTRPNAIFTMTIAAAIGALAAPSVVAAGAFAASAATGASITATTGETILNIMSTSKVLFGTAAAVAVLCIPIGYEITSNTLVGESAASPEMEHGTTGGLERKPPFTESMLFAEWRALHEKYGSGPESMPILFDVISKHDDAFRRRAFRTALVAEWAGLDPAGGFKFFAGKNEDSLKEQFLLEWLARDANAAVNHLIATKGEEHARPILTEIARKVPSRLAEIVERLPKSENFWNTSVRDSFAILAETDIAQARKAAENLAGDNREAALAGVALTWGKSDFPAVLKWAGSFGDEIDVDELKRAALEAQASIDPVAALNQVGIVPPGGRDGYFATSTGARVLRKAVEANFDGTLEWLVANPGRLRLEDLMGMAEVVTKKLNSDPLGFLNTYGSPDQLKVLDAPISSALLNGSAGQRRAVWEWLQAQPESEGLTRLRNNVLSSAAYQEPELALELAKDLPLKNEDTLRAVASSLLNGGSMLHRLDSLYPQAPDFLRPELMKAAFQSLGGDNLNNPRAWIDKLNLLPEDARGMGVGSIARAWAEQSPEEAVNWVAQLPAGETRDTAVESIVLKWAERDPDNAAAWVKQMPPGADRDRNTRAFISATVERNPQLAWQWALTISEPNERNNIAKVVAKVMTERDPGTAREWVESGPFNPETRNDLLQSMQLFAGAEKGEAGE